ncbi:tRNA-specific adenosine deaminase, partial [Acinetobacter baumannii]
GYYNHKFTFEHGYLHEKCAQQLSLFFKQRREQKKQEKQQKTSLND